MHRLREEAWVTLDGLEDYAVSSYGQVLDLKTNHEIVPEADPNGYLRVKMLARGKVRYIYLHRLVARAFFLNYKPSIEVFFKNNNKEDCTVLNLTLDREKVADESRPLSPPGKSTGGDA